MGPVDPSRVKATPATPARPEPMKKVVRSVRRVEIPRDSARSRLATVARMRHGPRQPGWRRHLLGWRAEDIPGQLLQDQADTEGDEESVQGTVIHPAQDGGLQGDAQESADQEADDQRNRKAERTAPQD